ncbi:MAG: hypothetical protein ACNI3C_07260 [Candidatus Marinarcus sp.]|uniref:hypothetical protein n=1 Tax=Candidatus Marinarcus sp. TaxID=3100987 RepID=UPI003B00B8DC
MNLEANYIDKSKYQTDGYKNINANSIKTDESLKKVCDDFESFFTQQLMEISLKSTPIAGEGTGADIIKGMYTDTIAQTSSGTLGISDMLYKYLSENNK